jgi:hypothetical protein
MVDLSDKSRHGPSERPQPFGIALCSSMPVVRDTLGHFSICLHNNLYYTIGIESFLEF